MHQWETKTAWICGRAAAVGLTHADDPLCTHIETRIFDIESVEGDTRLVPKWLGALVG